MVIGIAASGTTPYVLGGIKKCNENWCKAVSGDFKGWVKKESLWGLL